MHISSDCLMQFSAIIIISNNRRVLPGDEEIKADVWLLASFWTVGGRVRERVGGGEQKI